MSNAVDGGASSSNSIAKNFWDTNSSLDYVQYFNPYRINNEKVDIFVKGIPYVFMSCPVLNLCKTNIMADSFLAYMASSTDQNKAILNHLTHSKFIDDDDLYTGIGNLTYRLIPLITNTALSVDIKDTVSRTKEVGETFYGYKQVHPGSLVDSVVGDEISIKYLELADLPIIKMHKVWQDYIEKVRRGIFIPSKKALEDGYIDYMSSIYYILCDFDGETVKYWAKYTGVTPLNVPYSSLGGDFNAHEIPDITINYLYCYKEDMTMGVLRDFNRVSSGDDAIINLQWGLGNTNSDDSKSASNLIKDISEVTNDYPMIYKTSKDNNYSLKLKFFKASITDAGFTTNSIKSASASNGMQEYPYNFEPKKSDIPNKVEEYPYTFDSKNKKSSNINYKTI